MKKIRKGKKKVQNKEKYTAIMLYLFQFTYLKKSGKKCKLIESHSFFISHQLLFI